jgi:hypothetical protein
MNSDYVEVWLHNVLIVTSAWMWSIEKSKLQKEMNKIEIQEEVKTRNRESIVYVANGFTDS